MHNHCLQLIFIIYSCTAVFVTVAGQSTTDDNDDDNSLYTVMDQLIRTVATLQAKVAKLEATEGHKRKCAYRFYHTG